MNIMRNIFLTVASGMLLLACNGLDEMDFGKAEEIGDLEVKYSCEGTQVTALSYNSSSRTVTVDVELNNQQLHWTVESSDTTWLSVEPGEHQGNGSFSFNISVNPGFEAREPAVLSFCCGTFKGFDLEVSQSGNTFILSNIYQVVDSGSGSLAVDVQVKDDAQFEIEKSDWLDASWGGQTLTISWDENGSAARYGTIGLRRTGQEENEAVFNLFQFGAGLEYDDDGAVKVASKDADTLVVLAPANVVTDVACPSWVSYTTESVQDGVEYTFAFEDNPSDSRNVREAVMEFTLKDMAAPMKLPALRQDCYTAYGLMTGNGLKAFAQAWNAGESVEEWKNPDGTFTILSNIDLAGIEGWTPIGTADRPFTGVFDGTYHEICNLKSEKPLFGVCKGAEIRNLTIASSSEFFIGREFADQEYVLTSFVGRMEGGKMSGCVNEAPVTFGAHSYILKSQHIYVGGLAGILSGGAEIVSCENAGAVSLPDSSKTEYQIATLAVGGIAAANDGSLVSDCRNSGRLTDMARMYSHHVGGIVGLNNGDVDACSNTARISVDVDRSQDEYNLRAVEILYVGGIAGLNYRKVTGSANEGAVSVDTDAYYPFVGGVAGGLGRVGRTNMYKDVFSFDLTQIYVAGNSTSASGTVTSGGAARYGAVGGLFGGVSVPDFSLDLSDSEAKGDVTYLCGIDSVYPTYDIGGVIGLSTESLNLTGASSDNTVTVNVQNEDNTVGCTRFSVGGIIGYVEKSLTMQDCTASGHIRFNVSGVGFKANGVKTRVGTGGLAGLVNDGCVAKGCTNYKSMDFDAENKSSNGFPFAAGGIVGRINGGNSEFSDCHNKAAFKNSYRSNTKWNNSDDLDISCLGGILGQFHSFGSDAPETLKISSCTNDAVLASSRGAAGGIIGLAVGDIKVERCANTGSMASGSRTMAGGIAGVAYGGTVLSDCSAECIVCAGTSGGGPGRAGGIAGVLSTNSRIEGCSFSGEVQKPDDNDSYGPGYAGAIAGVVATEKSKSGYVTATADETCAVSGCRVKGIVGDVQLTESNYAGYLCGVAAPSSLTGNTYNN